MLWLVFLVMMMSNSAVFWFLGCHKELVRDGTQAVNQTLYCLGGKGIYCIPVKLGYCGCKKGIR